MADWVYPITQQIAGNTKIKEADNKLQAAMDDLVTWANGTATWAGVGLRDDVEALTVSIVSAVIEDTLVTEW